MQNSMLKKDPKLVNEDFSQQREKFQKFFKNQNPENIRNVVINTDQEI